LKQIRKLKLFARNIEKVISQLKGISIITRNRKIRFEVIEKIFKKSLTKIDISQIVIIKCITI